MTSLDRCLATLLVFSLSLLLLRESDVWMKTRDIRADIIVSVSGSVKKPGVWKLPAEARVIHAVERCGGLTSEANPEAVDLARPLRDGDHVVVASKSAPTLTGDPGPRLLELENVQAAQTKRRATEEPFGQGLPTLEEKPRPLPPRTRRKGKSSEPFIGQIDVNRADAEQLDRLPGVGPVLAQRILEARKMAPGGTFSSLEELETIRGIKGKTLLRLRPHLKLEGS